MKGRQTVRSIGTVTTREAEAAASFTALLQGSASLCRQSQEELVRAHQVHHLLFQGRMLCNVLRPRFMTPGRVALLARLSGLLAGVMERAGDCILRSSWALDCIGASELERDLWSVDPGYPGFTLSSRLDSFMVDDHPRFVEYNAESPAGIAFCDRLSDIFQTLNVMKQWEESKTLGRFHGQQQLFDTLLWAYEQWGGRETPRIAIVDWEHVITRRDFEICAEHFRENGVETVICDPRDLTYSGGRLFHKSEPITLVYRRVLLHELLDKADEAHALLGAYRDSAVCMVNSPRSKVLHKKAVFALLSEGTLPLDLDDEEKRAIDETIPWTRLLRDYRTSFEGREINVLPFVLEHRDRLVLKPVDDYAGHGVVLGWEATQDGWEASVEAALSQHFVVQERVPVPEAAFPVWHDDRLDVIPFMLDTDPLMFRGRMGSILTRIAGSSLLNVSAGSGSTTPTFIVQEA